MWRATWAADGGGVLLNQAPHNLGVAMDLRHADSCARILRVRLA
ncbi:MAG: hypothetical protein ACLRUN_14160 [Christensenellales bacterium]